MITKRITANLPSELLAEATRITGRGITETLIAGLQQLRDRKAGERAYQKFKRLQGKLDLQLDIDALRGRDPGR